MNPKSLRWSWIALVACLFVGVACNDNNNSSTGTPDGGTGGTGGTDGGVSLRREATLSGANEVPPVATPATGQVVSELRGKQLTITGSFENLSSALHDVQGSAAHVHEAAVGVNGPIVFNVQVTPGADQRSGTLSFTGDLTDAQLQSFRDGNLYVNVHSVDHPDGEIRAQLSETQPVLTKLDVALNGQNEVPQIDPAGSGTAHVRLVGNLLTITGDFSGLTSPLQDVQGSAAHIHEAAAGQTGQVVANLQVTPGVDGRSGTLSFARLLTETEVAQFAADLWYVDVHTTSHPDGEIRGQLTTPDLETVLDSRLTGTNEVPAVQTTAQGTATATLDGNTLKIQGSFQGLGSAPLEVQGSAAHVHVGAVGTSGPVVVNLTVTPGTDQRSGTFTLTGPLTDNNIQTLLTNQLYVDVHTVDHPDGEIRGQLLLRPQQAATPVAATLSGSAEVPPVQTTATGATTAALNGFQLTVSGQFSGLDSNLLDVSGSSAHVHEAAVGANGPIVFNLNVTPGTDQKSGSFQGTGTLDDAGVTAFRSGGLYVNVHSVNHPDGEIRAQLQTPATPVQ